MTAPLPRRWTVLSLAACAVAAVTVTAPAAQAHPAAESAVGDAHAAGATTAQHLDLGPADLPESRSTSTVQPGVTLTRITRGGTDPSLVWTVESLIPATSSSPDPDAPPRTVSDEASARALADRLVTEGYPARVEPVEQPRTADVPAGTLGYRVRVGSYPTRADADAVKTRLASYGHPAHTVYTGWDGGTTVRGPWHVNVVTIDPRAFRGTLTSSYGPDLYHRETTSALARAAGATVGTNAGFFVLDPASGAPGDPAGVGVYDGRLLSEPVAGRPGLVLRADAAGTSIRRLTWSGTARVAGRDVALDGVNRVPGLIRNCGGDGGDLPTALPLQDVTCTDADELVAFTPQYGPTTPTGPGREVVVDARGVVRAVSDTRGTSLPAGFTSLQGVGSGADALRAVKVGDRLPVRFGLADTSGHVLATPKDTSIVNGGPLLVRRGSEDVTQRQDGMVHPGDPSFAYGWVIERNPRTFAGVDAQGRTVLVTVDGRSTDDLGLSIPEEADVARSLGLVDAMNLDGGGSTTMALHGQVINRPSDSTGERPVGDALLVLPVRTR